MVAVSRGLARALAHSNLAHRCLVVSRHLMGRKAVAGRCLELGSEVASTSESPPPNLLVRMKEAHEPWGRSFEAHLRALLKSHCVDAHYSLLREDLSAALLGKDGDIDVLGVGGAQSFANFLGQSLCLMSDETRELTRGPHILIAEIGLNMGTTRDKFHSNVQSLEYLNRSAENCKRHQLAAVKALVLGGDFPDNATFEQVVQEDKRFVNFLASPGGVLICVQYVTPDSLMKFMQQQKEEANKLKEEDDKFKQENDKFKEEHNKFQDDFNKFKHDFEKWKQTVSSLLIAASQRTSELR